MIINIILNNLFNAISVLLVKETIFTIAKCIHVYLICMMLQHVFF
jgi:hypothetical protein